MKIAFIDGSPKVKDSASGRILDLLGNFIDGCEISKYKWNGMTIKKDEIASVFENQAIVLSFPLYVDGVPSHLMRCLAEIEDYVHNINKIVKSYIYVIVNNGFFDSNQNMPAIEIIERWSEHCGFVFGQGVGICGGGMIASIASVPYYQGPIEQVANSLRQLAGNIMNESSDSVILTGPAYPEDLYKEQAEEGWRIAIKANGLTEEDLDAKA